MVGYGILANAGLDYVTATCSATSGQVFLRKLGRELIEDATRSGARAKPLAAHGYEGVQAGHVGLAVSADRTMLRLSGGIADSHGRAVCRIADNVSRIDLQSTVLFTRDVAGLARHHEGEARKHMREGGRKRTTQLIVGREKGDTLNIGARSSNYYGRIYDKHRESGDEAFRRCWRYEVECKNDGAQVIRGFVNDHESDATAVASMVHGWFGARGIGVLYRPGLAYTPTAIGADHLDDQRALGWLRDSVAPSLRRLGERYTRAALIAWLFDGATMDDMEQDRKEVQVIAERYAELDG